MSKLSGSSSAPVIGNGEINFPNPSERQDVLPYKRPGNLPRSISLSNVLDVNDGPNANLDPDRLFTRHTISEVKVIQQRLRYVSIPAPLLLANQVSIRFRADADAKQEELRVMVG